MTRPTWGLGATSHRRDLGSSSPFPQTSGPNGVARRESPPQTPGGSNRRPPPVGPIGSRRVPPRVPTPYGASRIRAPEGRSCVFRPTPRSQSVPCGDSTERTRKRGPSFPSFSGLPTTLATGVVVGRGPCTSLSPSDVTRPSLLPSLPPVFPPFYFAVPPPFPLRFLPPTPPPLLPARWPAGDTTPPSPG